MASSTPNENDGVEEELPGLTTSPSITSGVAAATTTTPFHVIDEEEGLPLPIGMAEHISNATEPSKEIARVELIEADDRPDPPLAVLEQAINATDASNKITASDAKVECIEDDDDCPGLFNSLEFEDDVTAKKMGKEMNQKPSTLVRSSVDSMDCGEFQELEPREATFRFSLFERSYLHPAATPSPSPMQ